MGPKPVLQFNTYKVFKETHHAFDVFVPLPSLLAFFYFNLAYVFLLRSNYIFLSASFSVYCWSTCPTTQSRLLLMKMVNISIQKYPSACIAFSFSHLQFSLFLHFCVLVQQSQVLLSLLTIEHEKLGEKCSYLPDGCYRTASKSENAPTWGSKN